MPTSLDAGLLVIVYRLAVAAAIGLLIGLQREFAHRKDVEKDSTELLFAGARTMTLIAVLAFSSAAISERFLVPEFLMAVSLVVGALVTVSYVASSRRGQIGLTSEVSALIVFCLGTLAYTGPLPLVAIAGVATAAVLSAKKYTVSLVNRLTETDVHAFLVFCVLAVIILPLLPRVGPTLQPFTVLIPFRIGLMVVFISGIGFLGYVLSKVLGEQRAIGLTGAIGGLVSSTAVTLSLSRRSKVNPSMASYLAIGIVLSWAVMFARMLLEVAAINPDLIPAVSLSLGSALASCLAYGLFLYLRTATPVTADPTDYKNPVDLSPALTFGLLFAVILLISNAAQLYFGSTGIYASSLISGIADVDAITLSMSELSRGDTITDEVASRAIIIAAVSNTLGKAAIVGFVGGPNIRRTIFPGTLLIIATAAATAFV